MTKDTALPPQMSAYERETWARLEEHWNKRSRRRELPGWARTAAGKTSGAVRNATSKVGDTIPDPVRERAAKATGAMRDGMGQAAKKVADVALEPALRGVLQTLQLVNDWVAELNDPKTVVKIAQKKGLDIQDVAELRTRDLKDCDRLLARHTLKWRTFGAIEGGGMGALAMVPVAGFPASIAADFVVVQALSVSIANQVAYSYGFDAKDPAEQEFIQKLVNRTFIAQGATVAPMHQAARAAEAMRGRERWSKKLLENHKIAAALKSLMEKAGTKGGSASIQSVGKAMPLVGVAIGAGANAATLGAVAKEAQLYCQTRFLSEKYGLQMPGKLSDESEPADDEDILDEEPVESGDIAEGPTHGG